MVVAVAAVVTELIGQTKMRGCYSYSSGVKADWADKGAWLLTVAAVVAEEWYHSEPVTGHLRMRLPTGRPCGCCWGYCGVLTSLRRSIHQGAALGEQPIEIFAFPIPQNCLEALNTIVNWRRAAAGESAPLDKTWDALLEQAQAVLKSSTLQVCTKEGLGLVCDPF